VKRFGEFEAVKVSTSKLTGAKALASLAQRRWQDEHDADDLGRVAAVGGTISIFGLDPRTHGPEIRSRLGVVPKKTHSNWSCQFVTT